MSIERPVDFARDRHMLCRACGHEWIASSQWVHDFYLSKTTGCPECKEGCESSSRPRVTHDPKDPVLDDAFAVSVNWYHTSTHSDWPRTFYDPSHEWNEDHRRQMKVMFPKIDWGKKQMTLALHVGSYEAAIQNMLRRIADQADGGKQFYLYRVRLVPTVTFREDLLVDPAPAFGDLPLRDACPPGIDVARYLNLHEDEGGISIALGRDSIASVQRITVPLTTPPSPELLNQVTAQFAEAAAELVPAAHVFGSGEHTFEMPSVTPMMLMRNTVCDDLASLVPPLVFDDFERTAGHVLDPDDLAGSLGHLASIIDSIENPSWSFEQLDKQPVRTVSAA